MPHRSSTGDNNRANEGNQSSRHHQTRSLHKKPGKRDSTPSLNEPSPAHEYYPQFDHTGKGVNPSKNIERSSR